MTIAHDTEEFLKHFGVPGMKWGHRKASSDSASASRSEKKLAKADKKWEKKVTASFPYDVYNKGSASFNKKIDGFNSQPKWAKLDARNQKDPLTKQYFKEVGKLLSSEMNAAAKVHGVSPSGKKEIQFEHSDDGLDVVNWSVKER